MNKFFACWEYHGFSGWSLVVYHDEKPASKNVDGSKPNRTSFFEVPSTMIGEDGYPLMSQISKAFPKPKPEPKEESKPVKECKSYQDRVGEWLIACFGNEIAKDIKERNHRFLEESLELVQSTGCTASEAHQLVDYVFNRDIGEPFQEVGGVRTTLTALCIAININSDEAAETELKRIWSKIEEIRAKQAAKPKHSPLPIDIKD